MSEVAEEYLSRKGETLNDYHEYIKQPGNKGDELALHIMACMANISTIVVTKTSVWSTFDSDVSNAALVLVYLGKLVFQDMVPIPLKPKPEPPHKDVYKHEEAKTLDPNRHVTRSMGEVPLPPPLSPPPEHEPKPKCKRKKCKHKPRVKIVKEKEITMHRHCRCMTRKCPLCSKKVDTTKLLNQHVMDDHDNYQFLCKFCKCQHSYSSRNSVDRHIRHYLPPRFMCDACGKQLHEKYVFETHKNVHSDKCFTCTYPKCDCVYKSGAKY